MTDQSLDTILKGPEPKTEPVEQTATKEPDETPAKVETETQEVEDAAPPAEEEEEEKSVPFKALKDERQRRQKAEDRAAELERQISPPPQEELPDPAEDPEGYKKAVRVQVEREQLNDRITNSRKEMTEKYDDYEKLAKAFIVLSSMDPALEKEAMEHPKPAKFAYEYAKKYLADERKKLKEEMLAEKPSEAERRKKSAVEVPDLINATSATSGHVNKDKDLKDILGR